MRILRWFFANWLECLCWPGAIVAFFFVMYFGWKLNVHVIWSLSNGPEVEERIDALEKRVERLEGRE